MNSNHSVLATMLRWSSVGLLSLLVAGALSQPHMDVASCQLLLGLSMFAAFMVWSHNRQSWGWTQAAFLVLSAGLLALFFQFNVYSLYSVIVWIAATVGMMSLHRRRITQTSGAGTMPLAAGSVGGQPQQSLREVYSFDRNVQQARYRFTDLVGMVETKKRLLAAAEEIVRGSSKRNGVLVFGDPGNGKTLFAEALAGELKVPFMSITYGDLASKWINETPQKIDAMFREARRREVCVLFIDEIDSLLKSRDDGAHSMDRDMVNVMLTNISNLRGTRVVLVAATNFIDKLDAASIRDMRFDFKVEIPAPDMEARVGILRKSIGESLGFTAVDPAVVTSLAQRWAGFSASRLSSLGDQLAEMRKEGKFGPGKVTFDVAMQAMRQLQGRKGKLPEGVKTIDEIIMPAESRDVLRDMAYKMAHVYNLEMMGGSLPSGVIHFGPPGTGKTESAMALAQACGWAFLSTTGAKLIAKPDSWSKLVREAKDLRPAIVFIDEADPILLERRYSNVELLTNEILATLEGADGKVRDVMYIAATNHYDRLDEAVLRGGRFEQKIRFDVPEMQDMREYLVMKLNKVASSMYKVEPGVLNRLETALTGKSIANANAVVAQMVNQAALRALRSGVTEIRLGDVEDAVRAVFVDPRN